MSAFFIQEHSYHAENQPYAAGEECQNDSSDKESDSGCR